MNSNNKKTINIYGKKLEYNDRKNLIAYLTIGSSAFKFLRTFRFLRTLRHSMIALPFYSLLFCRELFNPNLLYEESIKCTKYLKDKNIL